jgi:hypothetical protein
MEDIQYKTWKKDDKDNLFLDVREEMGIRRG